jgi:DNA-binding PadR family transcriptional regulator
MFLGEFEQMVLLSIVQLGDEAYGVKIREEIEARTGRDVARGALYTTLDRIETKGLVTSVTGDSTAERGGRPRRYFAVSPVGMEALRASRKVLLNLWTGIEEALSEQS